MSDQTFQQKLNSLLAKGDSSAFTSSKGRLAVAAELNAKAQVEDFRKQLADFELLQSQANTAVQSYNKLIAGTTNPNLIAQYKNDQAPYLNDYNAYASRIKELNIYIKAVEKAKAPIKAELLALSDAAYAVNPVKVITKTNVTKITYNVGSVREAYFSGKEAFLKETAIHPGNTPVRVNNAVNLWAGGFANKGMIQTWSPPNGTSADTAVQTNFAGKTTALPPHGFQFQYNPTNVTMTYSGTPSVDMAFEASGSDKFNFIGTGTTQSTIGFQILLNRVYDMKYYDSEGHLRKDSQNAYFPVQPTKSEQEEIYYKGTMYDMEFLLRTLLGVTMPSYLRNTYLDGGTADMGFVAAVPVELHLGQNMRYLVWINQLSVNHVLFNERMVPLFTTVDISCNRMPDFGQLSDSYVASQTPSGPPAGYHRLSRADQNSQNLQTITVDGMVYVKD